MSEEFYGPCVVGLSRHNMFVGQDTMIYWTDVAASRRRSTLRTAEEEEDIWVEAFDLLPTSFTRLLLCKLL